MKTKFKVICTVVFAVLFFQFSAKAQFTITGKIIDATTGDGVPFATVGVKGTTLGAATNFEGLYKIVLKSRYDSLVVSCLGYKVKTKAINRQLNDQSVDFQLENASNQLSEVVIHAGENPAFRILRQVIKNKEKNDKKNLTAYQYESYAKVEIDVNNMSEKFKANELVKSVGTVVDKISKVAGEDGQPILPVFMSESISDIYYRNSPDRRKEIVKKSKVSGMGLADEAVIRELIGSSFFEYNFYQNYQSFLSKDFISPIADGWRITYNYYLADSTLIGDRMCYVLELEPKNKADLAYTGTIWIDKQTFALTQIAVTIPKEANINFIDRIKIEQDFDFIADKTWLPTQNRISIDVAQMSKNSAGMVAKFYISNQNHVLNQPKPIDFFDIPTETAEDAKENSNDFWLKNRPQPLSKDEKEVYALIDSVKNIPIVKTYVRLAELLTSGYQKIGKIDIGPFPLFYANNSFEGNRFRVGFRTNQDFNKDLSLNGYLAYGTKDKDLKYNAQINYVLNRKRWTEIGFQQQHEIQRIGINRDVVGEDYLAASFFAAFTSFGRFRQPFYKTESYVYLNTELSQGFSQTIAFRNRKFDPKFPFAYIPADPADAADAAVLQGIYDTAELIYRFRYAPSEVSVHNAHNRKVRLSRQRTLPIFSFEYVLGSSALGSDFTYNKFTLGISKIYNLGLVGRLSTNLTLGYTPSKIPYPLLEVHQGNQSAFYLANTFNLMNYFEFVSDRYVSLAFRHDFEGLLFNRLPLIQKLNWRLHASGKILMGGVRPENQTIIPDLNYLGEKVQQFSPLTFNKPYIEVGYGIDNIFKFLNVDFFHRLTYRNDANAQKFGVKLSFKITL